MARNVARNRKRKVKNVDLQKVKTRKLAVMMLIILLAFAGLGVRLYIMTRDNQNDYQKRILSHLEYDSKTLPFKRGSILDANGTILATSEKVYNVILDCKVMLDDEKNEEPMLAALSECFGLDRAELARYVKDNPTSQYYVLKRKISYDERQVFEEYKAKYNETAAEHNNTVKDGEKMGEINGGIWFEEEYIRRYPNNTLACDVVGFTSTDNNGQFGLEEYYNDTLNGTNGRQYGYLNDDSILERTTVPAVDGNSLVTTIDANIQAIIEKYLKQFSEAHLNEAREGLGAVNMGMIAMDCRNGNVLAMASYPDFDLNNPRDLSAYYTEEQIAQMQEDDTYFETLNALWRNFCISDTYEPGSTAKAITLAAGLETGRIVGNETYECGGILTVADRDIQCNVRPPGHGTLDVRGSLEQSCNVAFMKMGEAIGSKNLVEFENIFNIGLRTNIDLAGEARTASLVYTESTMGPSQLATSSFGQGFNVTMIEMAAAFSSIVNGGYYYEPHVVSKIINSNGDTIRNIEPRVLKQTISATTSELMREHLYMAVAEGTGRTARPAGYAIGGKTGTAEMVPRDKINYVVSFIGFAPADAPQIVVYCVIDRPNVADQPHASYATGIVKSVLTEVLPYMHISRTEEMTIAEQEEADNLLGNIVPKDESGEEEGSSEAQENGDEPASQEDAGGKSFYIIDPVTGELIDPDTGEKAEFNYSYEGGDSEGDDTGGDANPQ